MSSTTNTNPYSDSAVCACTSIINDDGEDIAANVPANNTIIKNIVLIFVVIVAFTLVNI